MFLSILVLKDALLQWNPILSGKHISTRNYFGVQYLLPDRLLLPQHYILGHSKDFNQYDQIENTCIICIGNPHKKITENNLCLCLNESASITDVFYEIQNCFYFYNTWENDLRKKLQGNASLEDLCNACVPIFNKPLFIHDTTFERLASVNQNCEQEMWTYDPEADKYYHPQEIVSYFKTSEEYLSTMQTYGAQLFSEKTFGYPILYINLRIDDIYVGRICICQLGDTIKKRDYELLEFFSEIVIAAFQQGNMLVQHSSQHLNNYFRSIINGKGIATSQLNKILSLYGWNVSDPFLCVNVFFQNPDYSINIFEYLTRRFAGKFMTSSVFQVTGQIVIILNLRIYGGTKESFFEELFMLLKDGLLTAGSSTVGHNFSNLLYYYRQANIAYQIGSNFSSKSLIYHFEDYSLQYFINQVTQDLLPEMICAPQILSLMNYDKAHHTEFTKTLHCYLTNERNIKQTACDLNIHRSTMNYRIERLHELLNLDLDNATVRLYLLISFMIIGS